MSNATSDSCKNGDLVGDGPRLPSKLLLTLLALILIFLCVTTIKVANIRGYWIDEIWTSFFALNDVDFSVTADRWTFDVHPPLYYAQMYLLQPITNGQIQNQRVANLIPLLGLFAIAAYAIINKKNSAAYALILISTAACSWTMFHYLPENRSYAWIVCVGLSTFICYYQILNEIDSKKLYYPILLGLLNALAVNLNYISAVVALLIALIYVFFLICLKNYRAAAIIATAAVAAILPLIASIYFSLSTLASSSPTWAAQDMSGFLGVASQSISISLKSNPFSSFTALFGAFLLIRTILQHKKIPKDSLFVIFCFASLVGTIVIMSIVNLIKPIGFSRYILYIEIVSLSLIAGLAEISVRTRARLIIVFPIFSLFMISWRFLAYTPEPNWFSTAAMVASIQADCPDTKVYPLTKKLMSNSRSPSIAANPAQGNPFGDDVRQLAYKMVADRFKIRLDDDQGSPSLGKCPTVIWVEHTGKIAADAVAIARLTNLGGPESIIEKGEIRKGYSGFIVVYPALN
jgi:hypothetical protein